MAINYNFDGAQSGVDEIPPPARGGAFRSGPSEEDKPFLDFVVRTLREKGGGMMPFDTAKERSMATYRIQRWIREEHEVSLRIYHRTVDAEYRLYWKLVDDDESSEDSDSQPAPHVHVSEEDVRSW